MTRDDVEAAQLRIRAVVRHTPLVLVEPGALPGTVMLKLEQLQYAGTFGVRAIFNQVLAALERSAFDAEAGIVATAAHARHVGRVLGLDVVVCADEDEAAARACATGALLCRAEDPQAIAGIGTIGLELWTQTAGQVDTVIVPAALVEGLTAALGRRVRIVEAGEHPRDKETAGRLWEERRIAVDPAAAAAFGVLENGLYRPAPEERVAVVLSSATSGIWSI